VQYLESRKLAKGNVEVSVSAEKLKTPARLGNFNVHVRCPVALTAEHTEGLMRSVHHCLVHNTLLTPAQIAIGLSVAESASGPR
jgi:uncharacterized OsmC-like protein